nr:hypothetical protein [Planctomycetota bacterium]
MTQPGIHGIRLSSMLRHITWCIGLLLCLVISNALTRAQDGALFDFQSAFWNNLHSYLHALTRAGAPLRDLLPAAATVDEQQQWATALTAYRNDYGKRSLLF